MAGFFLWGYLVTPVDNERGDKSKGMGLED